MKIKLRKIAIIFTAILTIGSVTFVASCDKEKNESTLPNNGKSICEGSLPFDYIGEQHNAFLYAIGEMYQDTMTLYAKMADEQTLDAEMQERLVKKMIDNLAVIEGEYKILGVDGETMNEYSKNIYSFLDMDNFNKYFFNSKMEGVLKQLLEKIEDCSDINEQREIVRAQEVVILENAKSLYDTCLVITLNVFEHSLAFWTDAYENEKNPWHNYLIATDNLELDVSFNTKSNILQGLGRVITNIKDKVVEVYHEVVKPTAAKLAKLALVDAGAAAVYSWTTPLAPGWVAASAIATSAGAGFLNWRTL